MRAGPGSHAAGAARLSCGMSLRTGGGASVLPGSLAWCPVSCFAPEGSDTKRAPLSAARRGLCWLGSEPSVAGGQGSRARGPGCGCNGEEGGRP